MNKDTTPATASAAAVKQEVKQQTRKIITLRVQLDALQKVVERDSLKIDAMQLKLEQVVKLLTAMCNPPKS